MNVSTLTGLPPLPLALILLAGCSQPLSTRERGVLTGGGLGATTGGPGAASGGAQGAIGDGLTSDQLQRQEIIQAEQ
jgi:hypothetical protein